jgi:signal transduction histidine kinase
LKSPLITIKGFLGFINRSIEEENYTSIKKDIQHIVNATNNMNFMLNDLLELSRIGRLINTPARVPFTKLIELSLQTVAGQIQEGNVSIILQEDLPDVFVDKPRLVEVLQNLINNAIKFSYSQTTPKIEIGVMNNDITPIFFIKDNGIGIEKKYHEKIFGLFERLEPSIEGTGIGLALVKRIIHLHNGEIWVDSAGKNQGTTFYFTLPWPDSEK